MTTQFKKQLSENKEVLKGKLLRITSKNFSGSFTTLKEFGLKILELESKGLSFICKGYYPKEGSAIECTDFNEIMQQIQENGARGILIVAKYIAKDKADYIKHHYTTC